MDPTQTRIFGRQEVVIDEVIGDIASSWFKYEMLAWNMNEKRMFLLFVALCKDFSTSSKQEAKQEDKKRKRESDEHNENAETQQQS